MAKITLILDVARVEQDICGQTKIVLRPKHESLLHSWESSEVRFAASGEITLELERPVFCPLAIGESIQLEFDPIHRDPTPPADRGYLVNASDPLYHTFTTDEVAEMMAPSKPRKETSHGPKNRKNRRIL